MTTDVATCWFWGR